MAWRIETSVLRGEIDNRARGRVTGRIWLAGRAEPIELDLSGNAWRDLAGRRLEFVNPEPTPPPADLAGFAARQTGAVGDITASRKVKVPEVSMDELMRLHEARKPFPWHWGNSLYLEWFGEQNGRVVIESATFQLTVSPAIAWDMTPAEEEEQRRANAAAMGNFMERLGDAVAGEQAHTPAPPAEDGDVFSDSFRPQTEAEAEQMQADSDRLADRINARMEREGPDADYEKILEEELDRRSRERGEPPPTPEEEARQAERIEEMHRIADEALANPDPEIEEELRRKHPLAERAFELSIRLMQEPEENGWLPPNASEEHPLADLAAATSKASAKLAGALNGTSWPPDVMFCAATIVRLKKARVYLDDALRTLESCQQQKLTPLDWLAGTMVELVNLAHDADELITELRERLG
jgi:hypothetical protein